MIYSKEVDNMCVVAKGPNHGPAPIPEEGKWIQAKEIKDISGYTHGVGPTNKTCSMSPDVSNPAAREITYDELFTDVCEQVDGLIEGGADVILIETIFDTLNCKAMIDAALTMMKKHGVELPVMISLTVSDLAGRTLSGQTVDAFLASLSPYPIFSAGMNYAFGAPQMKPFIEHMAQVAPYYISAHPNAGLPNEMGEYDETAESMAPQIAEFIDEGIVNIIGGCCGTSPEFIAHYARIAEGKKPHQVVEKPKYMWLSGLDLLQVDDSVHLPVDASRFVNVGERCNVAGSRKFLRLINEKNYEEAIGIARKQVADGAAVVDVNMDDGLLDAKAEMVNFLNMIAAEPDIAKVPVMIDSSKWDVIVAGLKCCQGKCIVNSISLKEGEEVFLSHARDVLRYGAAVVVMCFDENHVSTAFDKSVHLFAYIGEKLIVGNLAGGRIADVRAHGASLVGWSHISCNEAWFIRCRKLIAFDTCQSGTLECHFAGAVLQVIISLRNALARKSIRGNNIGASLQVASVNIRYHIRTSDVEHVVVAFHHTRQIAEPLASEVFFCKIILLNLSTHGTIENQNLLLYNLS
jgi:hypothetical protein